MKNTDDLHNLYKKKKKNNDDTAMWEKKSAIKRGVLYMLAALFIALSELAFIWFPL